jgi:hypothetical protein
MNRIHRGTNLLFALTVAVALGFGATQAIAAPNASSQAQACNKIFSAWCGNGAAGACANYCASLGFTSSSCSDDPYRPRSCCRCS